MIPARCSRSHGAPENWTAWVISWIVTHTSSCSLSTCIVRAACARLGATSSRRGGTVGSSRARSYWPSTRWESMPAIAPTCAPISSPPAALSVSYSGPRSCPGRFQLKRMRPVERPPGPSPSAASDSSTGRIVCRLAAIQLGRSTASRGGSCSGSSSPEYSLTRRANRSASGCTVSLSTWAVWLSVPGTRRSAPPHAARCSSRSRPHLEGSPDLGPTPISSLTGALLARRPTGRALARKPRGHRSSTRPAGHVPSAGAPAAGGPRGACGAARGAAEAGGGAGRAGVDASARRPAGRGGGGARAGASPDRAAAGRSGAGDPDRAPPAPGGGGGAGEPRWSLHSCRRRRASGSGASWNCTAGQPGGSTRCGPTCSWGA